MDRSTYRPNGPGHRALRILAEGPCHARALGRLVYSDDAECRVARAPYLIDQMLADALIEWRGDRLAIADLGLDALEELRAGFDWQGDAPVLAPARAKRRHLA